MSTGHLRRRLAQTALAVSTTVLAIGLLEVPALVGFNYGTLFGGQPEDTWLQLANGVNRADPELIHVHQPHTRYRGRVTGNLVEIGIPPRWYDVDVAYDGNGFRNDVDLTRADVVAIGDSFVEGAETPQPLTAVATIERRLGVPVANLGQSNYGPQQELVVLERYGLPLSPKVVVWFFFGGNDLRDVDTYASRRARSDVEPPPPFSDRSLSVNALRALVTLATPARREPSAEAKVRSAQFVRRDGTVETQYLDAPEGPWPARQWEVAAATLTRAHRITRDSGATFVVVYIPRKLRVYRDYLRADASSPAHTWPMNDLPSVLSSWCQERGLPFVDSTTALRAAAASGESVYLTDDVHWNAAGHRVAGEAVASRLLELGLLNVPRSRATHE